MGNTSAALFKIWSMCEQQGNRDPMPFVGQGNPRPAVGCALSVFWGSDTVPGHAGSQRRGLGDEERKSWAQNVSLEAVCEQEVLAVLQNSSEPESELPENP